jgi:hypothetical protein
VILPLSTINNQLQMGGTGRPQDVDEIDLGSSFKGGQVDCVNSFVVP